MTTHINQGYPLLLCYFLFPTCFSVASTCMCCGSNFFFGLNFFKPISIFQAGVKIAETGKLSPKLGHSELIINKSKCTT